MKTTYWGGEKNLSCPFYLYRFRKYVSCGFPIINLCNPGYILKRPEHIFNTYYRLHVSMFVTPSSGRPMRYLLKSYKLFAMLLHRLCYKIQYLPCFFYLQCLFFVIWYNSSPQWAMDSSFTRFLYHTQRRKTFGRTPLDG